MFAILETLIDCVVVQAISLLDDSSILQWTTTSQKQMKLQMVHFYGCSIKWKFLNKSWRFEKTFQNLKQLYPTDIQISYSLALFFSCFSYLPYSASTTDRD